MTGTFTCERCANIFNLVDDDTWNDEKAAQEFSDNFPEGKDHNVSVLCEDCFIVFKKWLITLTDEEKAKIKEDYFNDIINS